MKLRTVTAAALALATCIGLAACGSDNGKDNGKVTITVWNNVTTGDGATWWKDAAADYSKAHPNVTVKITAIQNEDMDGKLQTALQDPKSAPDIFMARGGQKLKDVVDAGQAMDLTNLISNTVKTQMATSLSSGTFDGKIYAVPQAVLPGGMWYSEDLFKQAGITETPQTWDQFKDAITKLKAAKIAPIAVGAKDAWPAAHWWYWFALRECSTTAFDAALNKKDFSNDCWTRTGNDVKELLDMSAFNEGFLTTPAQQGASSSAGLLANHMASMELMGGWEPGVIKDLTPDKKEMADLGYFGFPTMPNGEGDPKAIMGGVDGMAVGSWAPKEAVDFLNFISEKSYQEGYGKAMSTIPASKEAQGVVTNPALKQLLAVYDTSSKMETWLDTQFGQNIGNALNEGVVNLMAGKGTPADIVKDVKDAAAKG